MKIKQGFVVRTVGGETVVVPVGAMSKTFNGMINLNETGAMLWKFFTEEHTVEEATVLLQTEYQIDEDTAKKDAQAFVDNLVKHGFAE
jgi:AmiR/NasT family two-component response regulator